MREAISLRMSTFTIRKFKGILALTLALPRMSVARNGSADFLALVGENNCSKSSVLEALKLALPGTDFSKPAIDYFFNKNPENGPIEIEIEFDDITPADEAEQGIRTHVYNGKYRIKKIWETPGGNPSIWAFEIVKEIPTWPSPDGQKNHFVNAGGLWPAVIARYEEVFETLPTRITNVIRENIKQIVLEQFPDLVQERGATWVQNPGGFSSHLESVLPRAVFVPAIRDTKEEAEVTKTKSAARQIVEAMFGRQLAQHPAVRLYTEAGERVKELFSSQDGNDIVRGVERRIGDKLKRLIDVDATLDFSPPDINADLAGRTVLEICDGECKTKPEHQGHGAQRALILSLLELLAEDSALDVEETEFRRGIIILFEEPEIYLHPQMCRKMRDVLLSIARSGTAQVICTTHSPIFLDLADRHDGIALFRKDNGTVNVLQRTNDLFSETGAEEQRKRLRMILDFNPFVNEVYFGKEVCLVEGDCEIAAVEAIARKLSEENRIDWRKYLEAKRNLVIVNCDGKWTIPAFQRVLNGFEIPYRVVHDADAEGEEGANQAISVLLEDTNRRLMHTPNFERQIFQEEWTRDKPWRATRKIQRDGVNPELIRFFEFVLGSTIEEIRSD